MNPGTSQYGKFMKLFVLQVSGGWFSCLPYFSTFLYQRDWEREIMQEGFDDFEEGPESSVSG